MIAKASADGEAGVSDTVPDLLLRHQEVLAKINDAIAKGDRPTIKAWREAYKRISDELYAAGYYKQQMLGQSLGSSNT